MMRACGKCITTVRKRRLRCVPTCYREPDVRDGTDAGDFREAPLAGRLPVVRIVLVVRHVSPRSATGGTVRTRPAKSRSARQTLPGCRRMKLASFAPPALPAPTGPALYAVLFDIDGTLVQTGGAGQLAFAETFAADFGVSADLRRREVCRPQRSGDRHGAVRGPRSADERRELATISLKLRRRDCRMRCVAKEGRVLPGVATLLDALETIPHSAVGLLTGNIREGAETKLELLRPRPSDSPSAATATIPTTAARSRPSRWREAERFAAERTGRRHAAAGLDGHRRHDSRHSLCSGDWRPGRGDADGRFDPRRARRGSGRTSWSTTYPTRRPCWPCSTKRGPRECTTRRRFGVAT